mmetsp:Transcript_14352/g.22402  ORF Transcript_14352/g.22402 Transcript_14352/m.22402 type:complete len:295 (-) Transcript_14352:1255-2139(-)
MFGNDDEALPSWAKDAPQSEMKEESSDDDQESAPLFGTGTLSLRDENEKMPLAYGAIEKKPSSDQIQKEKKWHEEDDEEKEEEEDKDDGESALLSETDEISKDEQDDNAPEKKIPRKGVCLNLFHFLEFMGVLASIGLLTTQALPLFFVPIAEIGILQLALRLYVSLFCLSFMLVEFNVPARFIRDSTILQAYFSRGFIYSFIGLIGMEESYAVTVKTLTAEGNGGTHQYDAFRISWAPLFILVSSWLMVITGVLYMLLGICCMKKLRDSLNKKYEKQLKRFKDRKKKGKGKYQ